jgi:hypothetical protein
MASGSRLASEDRLSAQAISQLLQATHRSASTKMDFMLSSRRTQPCPAAKKGNALGLPVGSG